MIADNNKTYIERLRLRINSRDALSTRLRLDSAFSTLELKPAGLPQSAIVFIRRLRDPLPGLIPRELAREVPDAWGRAVAAAIGELARRAARPALEVVAADADAVLFIDRSELLACLAADWCYGRAIGRWWWQSLFRATDTMSAVINEWLASIEYAPAAFAKLAQQGDATTFASALPASATSRLLDKIIRHFGLAELHKSLSRFKHEPAQRGRGLSDHPVVSRSKPSEALSLSEATRLRTRLAPEAFAPRLEQTSRVLLAVALMLERAPSLLRERVFAARLLQALRAMDTPKPFAKPGSVERSLHNGVEATRLRAAGDENRPRPLVDSPQEKRRTDARVRRDSLNISHEEEAYDPKHSRFAMRDPIAGHDHADGKSNSNSIASSLVTVEHRALDVRQALPEPKTEVGATTIEAAIDTKFGGIFYLINAALALDLYGDFTMPLEPGIELPICDFLALAGREIVDERIEFDPIWPLLARLAGRDEGERPGARFNPPDECRMPAQWLKAFPETDEWSYQTSRGRLIVRHPAGFNVLDVKLGRGFRMKDIEARLASETCCYSNVGALKRRSFVTDGFRLREHEQRIEHWIRWMADYLRVRLARALGSGPADELITMLFARAARVEVSPARLDVFFSLADLPVEVRLAGLDRDPGWVPASGRAIAFHYD